TRSYTLSLHDALPIYLVRLHRRQHELEAASLPGFGPELDLTAERRGELTRDREAEAGPVAVPRPERPEDALLLLPRDAGPTVVRSEEHTLNSSHDQTS